MSNKTYTERAASEPTQLHKDFAEWIEAKTGIKVDLKTVQLAVTLRMDFQASPENQANLAARKAKAAADKKASTERKRAKLEAELAKLNATEPEVVAEPSKLTVVYGGSGPEVHKFGCADTKKMTAKMGFSKETVTVASHTALTEHIYADQIGSGESTIDDCYMGYEIKPCTPALNN